MTTGATAPTSGRLRLAVTPTRPLSTPTGRNQGNRFRPHSAGRRLRGVSREAPPAARPSAPAPRESRMFPLRMRVAQRPTGVASGGQATARERGGSCGPFLKLRVPRNFLGARRRPTACLRRFKESHLPKLGVYLLCSGSLPTWERRLENSRIPGFGRVAPTLSGLFSSSLKWKWWGPFGGGGGLEKKDVGTNRRSLLP